MCGNVAFHNHVVFLRIKSLSGTTCVERFGQNVAKVCVIMPSNGLASCLFVGTGMSLMALVLDGSGFSESTDITCPRYETSSFLKVHVLASRRKFTYRQRSKTCCKRVSCSSFDSPYIRMSSRYISTPSVSLNSSVIAR